MNRIVIILATICALHTAPVMGHEGEPRYDRASLSVAAERDVENDLLVAVLFAEHQVQRQQTVSKEVNEAIRWALTQAKRNAAVKVRTTQYNTSPIYNKQVITGWRARQSIRLESKDPDQLSELTGDLQTRLSIGSVNYAVSKPARDSIEESLTTEAIAQFSLPAELITRDLGWSSYRIVEMNIHTQGARPQSRAYASRGMVAMEQSLAPAIKAGVRQVSVNISGTIEVDAGVL